MSAMTRLHGDGAIRDEVMVVETPAAETPTSARPGDQAASDLTSRRANRATEAAEGRQHLLAGARAMVPWMLGVAPIGLVIGVSAARADIPTLAGWVSGPLIFGGSAQIATIHLLDSGAAPAVVVLAGLAVHLRLVLYSATMAPHWRGAPRWWQAAAAALLIDPSFVVGVAGYEGAATPRHGHLHYMGGAIALLAAWVTAITVGATLGTALPQALQLQLVLPLFLVGEIVPRLTSPATKRAAGAAAILGVVGTWAPLHLGALIAILGGTFVALRAEGPVR